MQTYPVRAAWAAPERWQRLALSVWLVIATLTCGRALLMSLPRHVGIYPVFAQAGQHWRGGQDLYPAKDEFVQFRYSPLVAALLVPIGVLPDMLGCFVFRLANLAVYILGLALWLRVGLPRTFTERQEAVFYLLLAPLSINGLVNMQTNGLVIGLLLLTAALAASGRWNWSAACMMLACMIKVYPIAFALLLAVAYPRRFAGRLLLALIVGLLLPFVLQHPNYVWQQYEAWGRLLVSDTGRQDWYSLDLWYRDVRFLCKIWLTPMSGETYRILQVSAAAALAGMCLAGRWAGWSCPRLAALALGLSCCWMLVLGPCTEACTYLLLAPALVWALVDSWSRTGQWLYRGTLLLAYGIFGLTFIGGLFPWGRAWQMLGPHPFGALLLFGALLAECVRQIVTSGETAAAPL
jgi:hypothetical protein